MNANILGTGGIYPVRAGQRELFVLSGTGPTSYSQTTADQINLGTGTYLDSVASGGLTVSGTYFVRAFPSAVNTTRATWKFRWYVTSTGVEVANAVNLSGESVQFYATGGEF